MMVPLADAALSEIVPGFIQRGLGGGALPCTAATVDKDMGKLVPQAPDDLVRFG